MPETVTQETVTARDAAYAIERALDTVHVGHDGHGSDDRAGYAAVAQVWATVGLARELRALRIVLGEMRDELIAEVQ